MELNSRNITFIGIVACAGAFIGVLADLFSGWSNAPNFMNAAVSIDIESIRGLYIGKPRWTFVLGNYLGVFFIPFHMAGFFLVYLALKPAGNIKSLIFLIGSFYLIAIGTGYHGTFAFIGDTIQSEDSELLMKMVPYWQNWGRLVVVGYLVISIYLSVLIVSGQTTYAKKSVLLSPLPLVILTAVFIALLPEGYYGAKAFLAVTGLNLPLLVFYIVTLISLLGRSPTAGASR